MKKVFHVMGFLILAGCISQQGFQKISNSDFSYSFEAPNSFVQEKNGRIANSGIKTNHSLWSGELGNDEEIFIDIFHTNNSCSPELTGATKTQDAPAGKWGRVNVWDDVNVEGFEYPKNSKSIFCSKSGTPQPSEAYSFCAEKSSKTVIICMTAMVNNDSLAKEIFESFRWTD